MSRSADYLYSHWFIYPSAIKLNYSFNFGKYISFLACGVAHQALEAIEPAGEDVLILGCGPVGLLAVGIAKALGAIRVYE